MKKFIFFALLVLLKESAASSWIQNAESYAPEPQNPDVFECATIGGGIRDCQKLGKKMLISLGGDTCGGSLDSAQNAKKLAYCIWNLFLGGKDMQDKRPFLWTVMDGVDVDMEIGSHKYYPDFVREMRRLMITDPSKQHLITAAPQCPFPDKWMGPQIQGSALEVHVDDNGSVQIDPADGEQIEITVIKEDGTHSTGYKV